MSSYCIPDMSRVYSLFLQDVPSQVEHCRAVITDDVICDIGPNETGLELKEALITRGFT